MRQFDTNDKDRVPGPAWVNVWIVSFWPPLFDDSQLALLEDGAHTHTHTTNMITVQFLVSTRTHTHTKEDQ